MKITTKACCVITMGLLLPVAAQQSTTETTEVTKSGAGGSETTTTTTTTFNPEARTQVVTYFDAYKGNPHGLPPGWSSRVKVKDVPVAWRTTRIAPGMVVSETHRTHLIDAPPELIKVLPAPTSGIRYYVAGSNVVAVDSSYKVVDSIQIPTIKYKDDGDEVEIESRENGRTTKIEVDKDDGEVEIEKD